MSCVNFSGNRKNCFRLSHFNCGMLIPRALSNMYFCCPQLQILCYAIFFCVCSFSPNSMCIKFRSTAQLNILLIN